MYILLFVIESNFSELRSSFVQERELFLSAIDYLLFLKCFCSEEFPLPLGAFRKGL